MAKKSASKQKPSGLKKLSRLSTNQLLAFVLVFAAVGGIIIWRSLAAPPTKTGSGLTLIGQTYIWNPNSPTTCQTEDDRWIRYYSGSLNGSFTNTYTLCSLSTTNYMWTAGNQGLEADVAASGPFKDLTITSPTGTVQHAVKMTCPSTVKGGGSTSCYNVCVVPHYNISTDSGAGVLDGGIWTITLSGQLSKITYTTRDDVTDVMFQQTYCPFSQQNLGP